jgi:di/tricarboxylate transporter
VGALADGSRRIGAKTVNSRSYGVRQSRIIAEQTGVQVLWSQWLLAFLPLILPTIITFWLTIRWLFPPDTLAHSQNQPSLQNITSVSGPWSREEHKASFWLLLVITLWATDFLHHTSPAAIGLGIGLLLILPKREYCRCTRRLPWE